MSVQVIDNFSYKGKKGNFERDNFDTLQAMRSYPEDGIDDGHVCFCNEDGNHYKFNRLNSVDGTTGRWRLHNKSVNTLTETGEGKVLDARQGKILKDLIDAKVIEAGGVSFDTVPTKGSTNPVTSNGIREAMDEQAESINSNIGIDDYPVFSTTEDYKSGDVVNYQGKLYQFTSDHNKGAWIGTDVEETDVAKMVNNIGANAGINEYIAFDETVAYTAGQIVNYDNSLYQFIVDHAAGAWNTNEVNAVLVRPESVFDLCRFATNVGFLRSGGSSIARNDYNWRYTDYIRVIPGMKFAFRTIQALNITVYAFYNKDKQVLSYFNGKDVDRKDPKASFQGIVTAPENAYYVRITIGSHTFKQNLQQVSGSAANQYAICINYEEKMVEYIDNKDNDVLEEAKSAIKPNTVSDLIYSSSSNGQDGVSVYRDIFSKAIWNTPTRYVVLCPTFVEPGSNVFILINLHFYLYETRQVINAVVSAFVNNSGLFANFSGTTDNDLLKIYYNNSDKNILFDFSREFDHGIVVIDNVSTTNRSNIKVENISIDFYSDDAVPLLPSNKYITDFWKDKNDTMYSRIEQYAYNFGYVRTNGIDINNDDYQGAPWRYTNYLPCFEQSIVYVHVLSHIAVCQVAFFDKDRNLIETHTGAENEEATTESEINTVYTAPAKTRFIRLCYNIRNRTFIPYCIIHLDNVMPNYLLLHDLIDIRNNIAELEESVPSDKPTREYISPYAIYTTCNDVVASLKGHNRNYSQAVYLDHFFNGFTEELNIRFKDGVDRVVMNAPMTVTDSNETNPSVQYNNGNNINEETKSYTIHGDDIADTNIQIKHRSVLNSVTASAHPKVLCIGDSITYGEQAFVPDDGYTQNHVYHLMCKEMFMKDQIDNGNSGYNITFLGIYQKSKTFTYKEQQYTAISHHEGRRGYSLTQYLNGSVPQFWDGEKFSINAWLSKYRTLSDDGVRLTVGDGTGTEINSGNINNYAVCTPTHVIIMLGANGGGTLEQYQQMVNLIKAELPNVIIGIAIPDNGGTYFPSLHPNMDEKCTFWKDTGSQGSRHSQYYGLQKMLQEYYGNETQENNNIYMLPFYFVMPTAESVASREVSLPDADYGLTSGNKYFDNYGWHASTHVNGIGQTNWAYCLYSWIKYTIAKAL